MVHADHQQEYGLREDGSARLTNGVDGRSPGALLWLRYDPDTAVVQERNGSIPSHPDVCCNCTASRLLTELP